MRRLATTVGLALIVASSAVAARGEDVSPCGRAAHAGGDQLERLTTSALEQFFVDALTKDMSFRFKDVRAAEPDPARPDPKHVARYTREFEDARPIEAGEWREHLDAAQGAIGLCQVGGPSLFFVNSREDVPYYLSGQAIQWAIRANVWFLSAHHEIEEVYDVVFKVSGVRAGNVDGVILRSSVRRARQ